MGKSLLRAAVVTLFLAVGASVGVTNAIAAPLSGAGSAVAGDPIWDVAPTGVVASVTDPIWD